MGEKGERGSGRGDGMRNVKGGDRDCDDGSF